MPGKVDVIQLRGRWVNRQADLCIQNMIDRTRERGYDVAYPKDVFGSAMVQHSRNLSLKKIRPDSDHVLFIDDDMIPVPGALLKLMQHKVPIASALCTTRTIPTTLAARIYDVETRRFQPVTKYNENVLTCGPWAPGFGFVVIETPVLFDIIEYVLAGKDWMEFNRPQLDRLCVRTEHREKERLRISEARRKMWAAEGIAAVFQMPLHDEFQQTISEDNYFFKLAHHMGVKVWLDTGCTVGHLGDFPYSPANLGMQLAQREDAAA